MSAFPPNIGNDALIVERAIRTAYTDEKRNKASRMRNGASRALGNIMEAALEAETERLRLKAGLALIAGEPMTPPPFAKPDLRGLAREILRGADVR